MNPTQPLPLLVVCGPTASGKTALAIALAKRFEGEIISADSMQIYRRMNIGTAKPTPEEMQGVPHHLLDILEPGEQFSVAQYVALARGTAAEIAARGRLPILAGGTGLYIDSLTRNIRFMEMQPDPALRGELRALAEQQGNLPVWQMLQECDPALAEQLHPNNLGRVIRGIEVYRQTGTPLSEWQRRSRREPAPYRLCMLGITYADRQALYRRIDARVDEMIAGGLPEEAAALLREGLSPTAAQAIGYKELFRYFAGEIPLEQAAEEIKRETRRYAKRQLTWLRRDKRIHWLQADRFANGQQLAQAAAAIAEREL